MAFPPPHHKLFPAFSSASSSCASEQSLGRGSCAAIFLQLFDWNCRHHRRRTLRRKSLPAERRSPPMVENKSCGGEDLASEDSCLRNENNESAPQAGESREDEALHTLERKKKKKRAPNVVAKLMGLESMPSPEIISKRQPLNPWNLNTVSDSSFRGRPVKLEKRLVGATEGHSWSSKRDYHGDGNELLDVQASSTSRHKSANPLISAMLSPLTEQNCVLGSMASPSKVYKPIVSPIKRTSTSKDAVFLYENRNPDPSTSARRACIVRSLVTSSAMAKSDEENSGKSKVEKKKAKHPYSAVLDTGSKRRCVPCSLQHYPSAVQSSTDQEKKELKEDEILSAPICLKRQRISANHGTHSHILPQVEGKQEKRSAIERASTSGVQITSKKRENVSPGKNTSRQDEIMLRLMQGKSAQGKDYGKCHHDETPASTGLKPKLAKGSHQRNIGKDESSILLKLQQSRSDHPNENIEKSKDSCVSNIKSHRLSCRTGKETRDASPLLKSSLIKGAAASGALDQLDFTTQRDHATLTEGSDITSIEEIHTASIEESAINSTDENVVLSRQNRGANLPGLESFDDDMDNKSSVSCITEEVHRTEDILSTYHAESKSDATTREQCSDEQNSCFTLGQDRTVSGEETSQSFHDEITESGCQSICNPSTEEVEDTASTNGSQKTQSISYSGKSTATILHELLISLNLSMGQSRFKAEDISREKSSRPSQPALGTNTGRTFGKNDSFDAECDNYHTHYSDDCNGVIFIPNRYSNNTTEVLQKVLAGADNENHTLRECNDKCWGEDPCQTDESHYFLIPAFSRTSDKHVEGGTPSFVHPKGDNIILTEEAYISRIVSNAHLPPHLPYTPALVFSGTLINSSLFFKLEKDAKHMWNCGCDEPKISSNNEEMQYNLDEATRAYRKLVFDCVKEALDLDVKTKSWTVEHHLSSGTSYMTMGICKKLDEWKRMACGMNVDDMVENSMNTSCGKWVDFSQEVSEVSIKLETQILGYLIDELVMDMGLC